MNPAVKPPSSPFNRADDPPVILHHYHRFEIIHGLSPFDPGMIRGQVVGDKIENETQTRRVIFCYLCPFLID
jgi:hypothetical protein